MKCTAVNINTNSFKTFFANLAQVFLLEVYSDIWITNQKKKNSVHIHTFIHSFIHSKSPLSHSKRHITTRKCQQFRTFKLLVKNSVWNTYWMSQCLLHYNQTCIQFYVYNHRMYCLIQTVLMYYIISLIRTLYIFNFIKIHYTKATSLHMGKDSDNRHSVFCHLTTEKIHCLTNEQCGMQWYKAALNSAGNFVLGIAISFKQFRTFNK